MSLIIAIIMIAVIIICSLRSDLRECNNLIEKLRGELKERERNADGLNARINNLLTELKEKVKVEKELADIKDAFTTETGRLNREKIALGLRADELRLIVLEKDNIISSLQTENIALKKKTAAREEEYSSKLLEAEERCQMLSLENAQLHIEADTLREDLRLKRDAERLSQILASENDQLWGEIEVLREDTERRREAEQRNAILITENDELKQSIQRYMKSLEESRELLRKTLSEPPLGFPTLLEVIRHYDEKRDAWISHYLKTKSHPALTAAQIVSAETQKRREAEYECRKTKLMLEYYLRTLPDMQEDYTISAEKTDVIESPPENDDEDISGRYLSDEEYYGLSITDRNQLALDRFWKRHKSKMLIGRLYEQYIGWLYERDGWLVEYYGITKGFSDLGGDLICHKDITTLIVQCKNWSKSKTIYEKHIFQLFGTTYEYMKNNPFEEVQGVFYTATSLSDLARSRAYRWRGKKY